MTFKDHIKNIEVNFFLSTNRLVKLINSAAVVHIFITLQFKRDYKIHYLYNSISLVVSSHL